MKKFKFACSLLNPSVKVGLNIKYKEAKNT